MRCSLGSCRRGTGGCAVVALVVALVGSLDSRPVAAESIFLNPPPGWNGVLISGSIRAGWRQSGGGAEVFTPASSFLAVNPYSPPITPGEVRTGTPISSTLLPTTGDAKDKAQVSLNYTLTVGAAGAGSSDKFNFSFSGETSAVNARYDFGGAVGLVNVDAVIAVDFLFTTFAPLPAATMASIGVPALPTLSAPAPNFEALSAKAKIGPYGSWTTVINMAPGSSAFTVPLTLTGGSDAFEYTMSYLLVTPHGTDPSVSFNLEGSMERADPSVPEFGLLAAPLALLCGAAGLLESRRRRHRPSGGRDQSRAEW